MEPPNRAFTPARIAALVLVGLTVLALGYLRFAPDHRVSVPDGAKAGELRLSPCTYGTEDRGYDADCGTLVVPENRADPASRLIAVPVTRVRARSAHPKEPVFRLEGGPGITNMRFPDASRFAADRDVVLVGYRGVDGSSVLDCPEVESAVAHATDRLGSSSFRAYADAFRSCADRLTGEGVDLDGYSMSQQADDLDAARKALGYRKIDLLSESAGTRLALIYAWRYPQRVHRSVMVGANPPGHFFWEPRTTDAQIGRYAKACAEDASCSARTDDLTASMRWTSAHIPHRWWFLPIHGANVRIASFFGLFETTPDAAPVNGPLTIGSWLDAADGDASGFWLASLMGDLVFPKMFTWGEYAAIGTQDAGAVDAFYRSGGDRGSILGNAGNDFAWGGGRLGDAWPTSPDDARYRRMRASRVPTLIVSGELDVTTPPQVAAKELLPYLGNGRQVVLPGFGHSASFWTQQPEAGTRLVTTFLSTGRVDDSLYERQRVDFAPSMSQGTIAKIALGSIVGLAALTVVSLLAMALRVRWRGPFGRKASAVLRSVFAIVLGLGGWLAGVLVALTALPGVPLDDELLATLSVGLPVGLGVYLGWARDSAARTRAIGLAAALAGALVGGWLGFNAAEGIAALLATIAGAVAGSNLILLVLDVAWDRQARERLAEPEAASFVEPRPAAG